ncbi:hypothetical protein ACROYT_G011850 [Oculina patagonica]
MCTGVSEQELSTRGNNTSERSMGSRHCRVVGMGHLDKYGAAAGDYETEKRTSKADFAFVLIQRYLQIQGIFKPVIYIGITANVMHIGLNVLLVDGVDIGFQ